MERIGIFAFDPFAIASMAFGALLSEDVPARQTPFCAFEPNVTPQNAQQWQPANASNLSIEHHEL
jgi:hypothetical protein